MIEHNSQNPYYRSPFGAVVRGTDVRLRLFVAASDVPNTVCICFEDGETVRMYEYIAMCGGRMYEATITIDKTRFYYFAVSFGGATVHYGNNEENYGGLGMQTDGLPTHLFQITAYTPYTCPAAYTGGIVYQIFPDRFRCGGDVPQQGIARAWGDTPYYKAEQFGGTYTADDFFGGTLYGIIEKLPYLKELGVTHLYLNPIFDSASNHGYNTRDYEQVKASLGGNEAFATLAEQARTYGIALILDGVFSHTGNDSRYFQSALSKPDSPYRSWYTFNDSEIGYDCWWGFRTLPNVCETDPAYMAYMLTDKNAVVPHWQHMGASGWRLDVADELPDAFLDALRIAVKAENPDAVLLGEVWEDASNKISYGQRRRYLEGAQLDSVMNYPFRAAVLDFVCGKCSAEAFRARILSLMENYPPPAFYGALNLLSSHDVPRLLTVLGDAPQSDDREFQSAYRLSPQSRALALARLRVALVLQMTLPGVPCIYYGDEAGLEGYADPFNRGTYPWGDEDVSCMALYRELLALRQSDEQFITGDLRFLYAWDGVLVYTRGTTAVMVNAAPDTKYIDLPRCNIHAEVAGLHYTICKISEQARE